MEPGLSSDKQTYQRAEDGSKTINGIITDYLDQIPQENVCIEINGYRIEILNIVDNSIDKVKIKKKES